MTTSGWSAFAHLLANANAIGHNVRALLLVASFAGGLMFGQVARAVGLV